MINGLISFWARNTVAANLLMIVALVGGLMGYIRLEKEVFPVGEQAGAEITMTWPGASPQEVEEQIVVRIEEAVADLDGIDRLISVAREGSAYVRVEALQSVDRQEFLDEVKLRIDSINNFPNSAFRPVVQRREFQNQWAGMVVHGEIDKLELKRITDDLRDEAARLPGGETAQSQAVLSEEVTIEVSENTLRRYNLTFDEVAAAIRAGSLNASGGDVRTATGDVSIQARKLADTSEQFGDITIRQTPDGGVIKLRDIAEIHDGFVDVDLKSTYNGRTSTFIMFFSVDDMDLPKYSDAVKNFIEERNETLPEGVKLDLLWSDDDFFSKLVDIIASSAMLGTVLVLCILVLFLRPIVAFWVAVGILTAFAGGFMLLPTMGVSLNLLTLFACLLVIGIVVDDAIVIGENIHTEVESGRREGVEAAIHATKAMSKPVIFGVLTTMIAFAPWALLSGDQRQFTQNFTLTVIAALTFSLIEAFLILPAHLAHLKPQKVGKGLGGDFTRMQRNVADSLLWVAKNIFQPVLEVALRMRYATLAFFIMLFMFATALMSTGFVKVRIEPEIQGDLVFVNIEMPDGTPFTRVSEVADQLSDGLDKLRADINPKWEHLGEDMIQDGSIIAYDTQIQAYISVMTPEKRPVTISTDDFATGLREMTGPIPDAEDARFTAGFGNSDQRLRFALNHPDLDVLRTAADELKAHLATYAQAYNVGDNISAAGNEIRIDLKPGAESLGVTLADVTNQVRQAYFGTEVQRLPRGGEDVRVMLRLPEEARRSLDSLSELRIRTNDNREIPLFEVAELEYAPGINRILRRERQRSVSVFAEVAGESQREIIQSVNENFIPKLTEEFPGLTSGAIGSAESEQEFVQEIMMLQLMSFFVMYCLLAIAFKSYWQPFLIMTAIPFAFTGAVFGHLGFGVTMNIFSWFGVAAAAGVVINDNLVLIDYLNKRREQGAPAMEAVVESAVQRFRPILLTSVTTFIGILPMILDRSMQAQFLRPMVVSLGSAVLFALFVSLFLVPSLYLIGTEFRRYYLWLFKGEPFRKIGERFHGVDVDVLGEASTKVAAEPAE